MIKIKFNDKENFEEVEFSRNENIITLKGITEENNSGFKTYRMSGEQLGDFSDYTTTYRLLDDEVQYSNDGSVWVEPETHPYEPTVEDKINALKKKLADTDYEAIKYSEGWFTDEEYAPIKAKRESLREQIRKLEINCII